MADEEPRSIILVKKVDISDLAERLGEFRKEYLQLQKDLESSTLDYRKSLAVGISDLLIDRTEIVASMGKMVDLEEDTRAGIFKDSLFGDKWVFKIHKKDKRMTVNFRGARVNPQINRVKVEERESTSMFISFANDNSLKNAWFESTLAHGATQGPLEEFIKKQRQRRGDQHPRGRIELVNNPDIKIILWENTFNSLVGFDTMKSSGYIYNVNTGYFEHRKGNNTGRFTPKELKLAYSDLLDRLTFSK